MPLAQVLVLGVLLGCLASCQTAPIVSTTFSLMIAVESDPGVRIEGTPVLIDGTSVGETDADGVLRASVSGQVGKQIRIEHDCPRGHDPASAAKFLRLRGFEQPNQSDSSVLGITLHCRPSTRLAVFVVRARHGAGLPILLDGRNVGETSSSGVAHFSTSAVPGTDFTVELVTRNHPELRPQRPRYLMTLPEADEVFVINQSFDRVRRGRQRGARRLKISKIE